MEVDNTPRMYAVLQWSAMQCAPLHMKRNIGSLGVEVYVECRAGKQEDQKQEVDAVVLLTNAGAQQKAMMIHPPNAPTEISHAFQAVHSGFISQQGPNPTVSTALLVLQHAIEREKLGVTPSTNTAVVGSDWSPQAALEAELRAFQVGLVTHHRISGWGKDCPRVCV